MNARGMVRRAGLTLGVCLLAVSAFAQATATQKPAQPQPFEPKVGQAGKDVVWVPTSQALVDKMLDMAKVTPQDFVMDLGSGDGRTVITAAKRGATAMGIEYNPDMVELSKKNAAKENVSAKATFVKADLFETDFSKATVITMFLLPDINVKLRPKILNLKPGTRVVSNSFTMEDWEAGPDRDHHRRMHELVHGAPVDRAGEGRGHVDDAAGRSQAHADVPEALRHARHDRGRGQDERRPDHVHGRQDDLHRQGERHDDPGHGAGAWTATKR